MSKVESDPKYKFTGDYYDLNWSLLFRRPSNKITTTGVEKKIVEVIQIKTDKNILILNQNLKSTHLKPSR